MSGHGRGYALFEYGAVHSSFEKYDGLKCFLTHVLSQVAGEISKNHQDDSEDIDKGGEIPDIWITNCFNPYVFMEEFRRFHPPVNEKHCGRFFLTPKRVTKAWDLWDPSNKILYNAGQPLGHNQVSILVN